MFTRGANPIWSFVDLIGQQLDDTYYISFLSNIFPYVPQLVTSDDQGLVPIAQPIEFLANGTLSPDIYGDPNLVYRLEIRNGPTQFDQLIYAVNNYVFEGGSGSSASSNAGQDNQISNPQFSVVNFLNTPGNQNPLVTFNAAGTYNVAPGWELVLAGSGTCSIEQVISAGTDNTADDPVPPYYLEVNASGGWTSVILQQTLNGNGDIWYNNYAVANLLIKSNDSTAHNVTVNYVPNSPGNQVGIINQAPMEIGAFGVIQGSVALFPPDNSNSSNSTANNAAFVQIQIVLPNIGIIDISNVQVYSVQNIDGIDITTFGTQPEETIERQMDHLAHYYQPKLAFKPIPSWLVGWDFPLNPAQFGSSIALGSIGANKSAYTWDNTIVFQSVNSAISVSRGAQNGLQLTAAATTQAAVIQYIQAPAANKILQNNMAVNIVGNCAASTTLPTTVSLWYTKAALPSLVAGTNNSIVATLDANGKPATLNGTWTEIPLKLGQEAEFTLTSTITSFSFPFWQPPIQSEINAATFIAIVIGFSSIPDGTINPQIISVSLNTGDIATIPPAETYDEVLRKCQYFYEQSYDPGTTVPSATFIGAELFNGTLYNDQFGSSGCTLFPNDINLRFKQQKRVIPNVVAYAPDGTPNAISTGVRVGTSLPTPTSGTNPRDTATTVWTTTGLVSTSNCVFSTNTASGGSAILTISTQQPAGIPEFQFQYTADARLGIV